jgi:hypothetical protein
VPEPARIVVDDDAERRHLAADLQQLVDLLLILGQRELRAGMLDDIGKLVGHRILVDRYRHPAQGLRRAHRPIEPGAVVADHDQPIAALESQVGQAGRQPPDLGGDMGPVIGLPDAVFLLAIGRTARAGAGALRQKLGKRVPSVGRAICRPRRHPSPCSLSLPFACWFCAAISTGRQPQIAIVNLQRSSQRPAAGSR